MTGIFNARILASIAMLVFVGAAVASSTGAFFNDTETSTGNTFTAGDIDLQIDSVAHYNGMVCTLVGATYHYIPEDSVTLNASSTPIAAADMNEQSEWDTYNALPANAAQFPEAGATCTGTWAVGNLDENTLGMDEFFNFSDIKPGDTGENTISVHVGSNDAWMCASIANIGDADNTQTEPEAGDVDDVDDLAGGELDNNLEFFAWADDGDNVFEVGESALGGPVSASSLSATTWALAEGGGTPIQGGSTSYVGLAWCAGDIGTPTPGSPIECDGGAMGNEAQTDSWNADLTFYIEQSRNNAEFQCSDLLNT
jgi:predicted ribosomally synthesized peptide with SipW-like signal peptide